MSATKISGGADLNANIPIRATDAKTNKGVVKAMAKPVDIVGHGSVLSVVPPETSTKKVVPITGRQTSGGEPSATSSVNQAATTNAKHAATMVEPTTLSDVVQPQDATTSAAVVVATLGVDVNIPAAAGQVDVPCNLTSQNSPKMSTTSTGVKLNQASTAAETVKEAPAKPDMAAVRELAPPSAGAAVVQFKTQHGAAAAVPVASATNGNGASSTMETVSPAASTSHLSPPTAPSTVAQAVVQPHAASPSLQTDIQLHAADFLDASGIKNVRVLPGGPTQLEVGVLDGTHGWLRIRAELGADGAVNASLTANALAHESLRAALPQMVEYLGSETVSVTRLEVHRFAEDILATPNATDANQQSGGSSGHTARGQEPPDSGLAQKHLPAAIDADRSGPVLPVRGGVADRNVVDTADLSPWNRGLSRLSPQVQWPFAALDGVSGGWLNVSA